MKRVLLSIAFIFVSLALVPSGFARMWCEWNGTNGVNCQSDSQGFIIIDGFPVRTPSIANARGYYLVTTTTPELTNNQVYSTELWGKVENSLTQTWLVRTKTTEELDTETAAAMQLDVYWLWKALLLKGLITKQEAATVLPQSVIDAYLARERLEE